MPARASSFRALAVTVALAATCAQAEPRTVLLGSGDCKDAELVTHLRSLGAALKSRMAGRLLDDAAVLEKLRPQPQASAEQLRRQLDVARMQLYQADFKRAEVELTFVRDEVLKLPPGPDRFGLWVDSELLRALLYRETLRAELSDEAFRQVLRMRPALALDANIFSPGAVKRFEKLRKDITTGGRGKLEVRTSPPGAELFLEGAKIGRSPFTGEIPLGSYSLSVVKDALTALPRQVTVAGPLQLQIDLGFEGAIQSSRVTCLSLGGDEGIRLRNAVRFATLVDVEEIIVLRVERPSSGPAWLAASLVNVETAQKVREGGIELSDPVLGLERSDGGAAPEALEELATFLVTGERTTRVETPPAAAMATALRPETALPLEEPTSVSEVQAPASRSWRRPLSYALGGVGLASLCAGVFFALQAGSARSEFDSYKLPSGSIDPDRRFEAAAARDRAASQQTLSFVTLGVGAAALGTGAFLFFTSEQAAQVSLMPSPEGAVLVASFRY